MKSRNQECKTEAEKIETEKDIEEYIKDASEENEELYKDFGKTEGSSEVPKPHSKRNIQSAHPYGLTSNIAEETKIPLNPSHRPTTVPLAVVKERLVKNIRKHNVKRYKVKNLKQIKATKGGGFTVMTTSGFNTMRPHTGSNRYKDNGIPSCMIIKSQQMNPNVHYSSTSLHQQNSKGMYMTTSTMRSPLVKEDSSPKNIQQINVVTNSVTQARPTTAAADLAQSEFLLKSKEDRPMSAYIITGKFLQKKLKYMPTEYIKPFTARQRPISASVNYKVFCAKNYLSKIQPEKVKLKYLKYLKDLESGANNFAIQDDNEQIKNNSLTNEKEAKMIRKTMNLKIMI